MHSVQALEERLQVLHRRTAETPLFNPVFQLGLELSREIESGTLGLDAVENMVAELECEGLQARARRLHRLVTPLSLEANTARLAELASGDEFNAFAAHWRHPFAHIVFTAHPTFLLSRAQSAAVAGKWGVR